MIHTANIGVLVVSNMPKIYQVVLRLSTVYRRRRNMYSWMLLVAQLTLEWSIYDWLIECFVGAPKIDQHFVPRVEQSANLDRTTVYVPFCANPKPADSGSYWLITNERVNMGERLDNILAQPIQKVK